MKRNRVSGFPWIYLCFFLSGFSGLVNEVVWSRLFVYTMGSSHLSIAVVVSVFMGGLALGSLWGGPLADRSPSPLRLYGWVVALAGILSGAVAPLLWLADPLLGFAYRLHDGQPGHPMFTAVKAVVCAATILVPTTLMGATLPALARYSARNANEVGARLGMLYGVNTFGAVAGSAAAGFYLIGQLGLGWTMALAAAIDVLVGAAVLLAVPRPAARPAVLPAESAARSSASSAGVPGAEAPAARREPIPFYLRAAVIAFAMSGFANMCLQLGWTRALVLSLGNSTYAFSVIVGIFIFGLAAGGWIAGLFADRTKNPAALFGWLLMATAVASALTIPWLGLSPARFTYALYELALKDNLNYTSLLTRGAASVALVILPATLLMGMALPLVGRLWAQFDSLGRAVGIAYASNTAGAILGTAITGFVLVPLFGRAWGLLYLAVGLGLLAGVMVLLTAPGSRRGLRFGLLAALVAGLAGLSWWTRPYGVFPSPGKESLYWHPVVFSLGAYTNVTNARAYASYEQYAEAQVRRYECLYYRDGEAASVAVLKDRSSGHVMLNISGKTDASAGEVSFDTQTQLLMGHLPILAHPAPRRALNLGLGGGMSLGAMTLHSEIESIDLLELSPEVEEAARLHFAEVNQSALTHPKVNKVIGDGRNHLTHTGRTYDIISSEPSNFWIAGLGNLFTEEFYRLALKRLNPGGLVCQWIYGYSIRLQDFQVALRTFLEVFPYTLVFANSYADTLLLGSTEPIRFDRARMLAGMSDSEVRGELSTIGIDAPEDVFRYFICRGPDLRSWVGEGLTNRDYHPVLEYSSPLGYYSAEKGIVPAMSAAAPPEIPAEIFSGFSAEGLQTIARRRQTGRILGDFCLELYKWAYAPAVEHYKRLAQQGDIWAISFAAADLAHYLPTGSEETSKLVISAREAFDTPDLVLADNFRPLPGRDARTQLETYRRVVSAAPRSRWQPYLAMAYLEGAGKNLAEALKCIETAKDRRAPAHRIALSRGLVLGLNGKLNEAEQSLRESLDLCPPGAKSERNEAEWNLGFCLEQQRRLGEAVSAYRSAMINGRDPVGCTVAMARCLRLNGRVEVALKEAAVAVRLSDQTGRLPGEARAELARVHLAAGDFENALKWMGEAAKRAPGYYERELNEMRLRAKQ